MLRTDLEDTVHRLANRLERELGDIIQLLLVESRTEAIGDVCWSGARFIETLRGVRDGKEGGEV
jgi:hypothetical protein